MKFLDGFFMDEHKERSQQITSGLAKLGGGVIIRISVYPLTVSDNPNCVQLPPQLRQAAGTLSASGGSAVGKESENRKIISNILMFRTSI